MRRSPGQHYGIRPPAVRANYHAASAADASRGRICRRKNRCPVRPAGGCCAARRFLSRRREHFQAKLKPVRRKSNANGIRSKYRCDRLLASPPPSGLLPGGPPTYASGAVAPSGAHYFSLTRCYRSVSISRRLGVTGQYSSVSVMMPRVSTVAARCRNVSR